MIYILKNNAIVLLIHSFIVGMIYILNFTSMDYFILQGSIDTSFNLIYLLIPSILYILLGAFFLKSSGRILKDFFSVSFVLITAFMLWFFAYFTMWLSPPPLVSDYFGDLKALLVNREYWHVYKIYNFPFANYFENLGIEKTAYVSTGYLIYSISIFLPSVLMFIGLIIKSLRKIE